MRAKPELLAPVGNMPMLHAAVSAGADAVYLGMGDFNARRNADNFNSSSFEEACRYAHLRGVRVYVALNTIVLPSEVKPAVECAKMCDKLGADGFIVADIGLACAIKTALPEACIHISTQMNVHSIDGLLACAALGAMRVTLARELSIAEISAICEAAKSLDIEIETFVHGALCFCYSGQCLMSSMIGGRSANRGLCAQPCRLPYELVGENGKMESNVAGAHLLSPKDLCGLDDLAELIDSGVSSLKIEGRMKSPEYVHTTVSVYRREIDRICNSTIDKSNNLAVDSSSHDTDVQLEVSGQIDLEPRSQGSIFLTNPRRTPESQDKESTLSNSIKNRDTRSTTTNAKKQLEAVFSRGFTSGYLDGDRSNAIMGYGRPNNRGQFVGRIKKLDASSVMLESDIDVVAGDVLQVWTKRGNITINVDEVSANPGDVLRIKYSFATDTSQTKATMQQGDRVFRVRSKDAEFNDNASEPAIPVKCRVELKIGKPLIVEFEVDSNVDGEPERLIAQRLREVCNDQELKVLYSGDIVEPARTKSVSVDDVSEHVGRMGGSDFAMTSFDVILDEDAGIGFSQLHKARKQALEKLKDVILAAYITPKADALESPVWLNGYNEISRGLQNSSKDPSRDCTIYALVANPDCARTAKRAGADFIYVNAYDYRRGASSMQGAVEDVTRQAGYPKGCIISMPSIIHDDASDSESRTNDPWDLAKADSSLLVGSIGALYHAEAIGAMPQIASTLSIANSESLKVACAAGAELVWLSPELEIKQLEEIARANKNEIELGICVNGYQELMVSEHCVLMSMGDCAQECRSCPRRRKRHFLRDRKGYEFPVYTDDAGRSHILNSVEYDVIHAIKDLQRAGIYTYMVDATMMTPEECAQRVGKLSKAIELAASGRALDKEQGKTTGHLFREVL